MRVYTLLTTFLVVMFLLGCNEEQEQHTTAPDTPRASNTMSKPDSTALQTFAGRPISFYLAHPQIPSIAKDLYLQKVSVTAEGNILALMDSVFSPNNETAPFYFLVITQTMEKADGAYSEPLGMMAKEYVETNPSEFLGYFMNEPLLIDKNFDEWARCVAGEIMIAMEGQEMAELSKVTDRMKSNCTDCSSQARQKLDDFVARVKSYLQHPR